MHGSALRPILVRGRIDSGRTTMEAGESRPLAARRTLEHWVLFAGSLSSVLAIALLGLLVDPDPRGFGTHEKLGLAPCRAIQWWNIPCPGCGVTTSVTQIAHGDFLAGFVTQPFGWVVVGTAVTAAVWAIVGVVRGRDLYRDLQSRDLRLAGLFAACAMVVSWIYKIAVVRGWIA
jgi:hypothetical protein